MNPKVGAVNPLNALALPKPHPSQPAPNIAPINALRPAPMTASACDEESTRRPLSTGDDLVACLFAQTEHPAAFSMLLTTPSPKVFMRPLLDLRAA